MIGNENSARLNHFFSRYHYCQLVSPILVGLSLFPLFVLACRRVIIIIAKIKG
ncbi:hypothetical protein N44_04536 [Microcystis aeruginosa NIES-44]|uniref:Uncharacterized protein n=1 Tax=Microcystis aeruginosa NIES-44 TaxID=449439 RepID=A0A0A1W113_MICAE|nr:hypothetical protein N44_04536 [Microcystis aeruginosa NIES-44]